ncbi:MAG: hypothetical protein ACRCZP_09190, partial [Phycicoccus sp.]
GDPEFFARSPVSLGSYEYAWLGPVWYFAANDLWPWANAGEFRKVSQAVNGGAGRVGTPFVPNGMGDRDAMYQVFLRAGDALLPGRPTPTPRPPQEEDDMFTDQDRALLVQLARRDDLGHARSQILSRLGVADPVSYPDRRTPEEIEVDEPARRVDVGHVLAELRAEVAALRARPQIDHAELARQLIAALRPPT